jgi:hypothetical protein
MVEVCFVDHGISSSFPPGSQAWVVVGTEGRDQDVPELSDDVPYDPFKVDISTIGLQYRYKSLTWGLFNSRCCNAYFAQGRSEDRFLM